MQQEPQAPVEPDLGPTLRAAVGAAVGLVVLSSLLGISGDWFSSGSSVSYLAAWSGAVLMVTAAALVLAVVRMVRAGRDVSLAIGVLALVWAGQIAALLTGLGEEALDVGPGAAGAAAGLPPALALALDGLVTGRTEGIPRWSLAVVGIGLGTVLALGLTLLPLGEPQARITIIR